MVSVPLPETNRARGENSTAGTPSEPAWKVSVSKVFPSKNSSTVRLFPFRTVLALNTLRSILRVQEPPRLPEREWQLYRLLVGDFGYRCYAARSRRKLVRIIRRKSFP